jgi:uracil-DNA glycosylase
MAKFKASADAVEGEEANAVVLGDMSREETAGALHMPTPLAKVGEVSGDDDVKLGVPFSGGAGSWLRILTKAAKKPLDHFHIIQSIGCHTPNNIHPNKVPAPD